MILLGTTYSSQLLAVPRSSTISIIMVCAPNDDCQAQPEATCCFCWRPCACRCFLFLLPCRAALCAFTSCPLIPPPSPLNSPHPHTHSPVPVRMASFMPVLSWLSLTLSG